MEQMCFNMAKAAPSLVSSKLLAEFIKVVPLQMPST